MDGIQSWWEKPLRVIQPNLQVKDTDKIIPAKLAEQMQQLSANAMVFNVGGIYAWYNTKVAYHYRNPFLPDDFDLLDEVIRECHKKGIRFIARFDFSKATDYVYQSRPEWFVRDPEGMPEIIGANRPGEWTLLMSTCTNGRYRNDAVALPVLNEVLSNYEVDGVFYNAPGFIPCWCETCRRKYQELYHKRLPDNPEDFEESWPTVCIHDNIEKFYSFIKNKAPDVPVILYYGVTGKNIMRNESITDMICTESQDILSLGWKEKPELWKPSLTMKVGRAFHKLPYPFGIIHSSPGMDWRHTGLPTAEYKPWLCQIPANGGHIWHSITGIPDTIVDKRIAHTIGWINGLVKKVEDHMDGAVLKAETALLWDGSPEAEGWAEGLLNKQVQFDVLLAEQADLQQISKFKVIIVPEGWPVSKEFADELKTFVKQGGNVLVEGRIHGEYDDVEDLLGITDEICQSEKLIASYIRFEGDNNPLQIGMEETELIPHRGRVLYCHPQAGVNILATLVPPFSPLESVGAPPERASLPVSYTDIPLGILNHYGNGYSLYLPFSLSRLVGKYKLEEHTLLMANAVYLLVGKNRFVKTTSFQGLQVSVFEKENDYLVHLVNESGSRPLQQNIPLHDIVIEMKPDSGMTVSRVRRLIAGDDLEFSNANGICKVSVPQLDVWECLKFTTVKKNA